MRDKATPRPWRWLFIGTMGNMHLVGSDDNLVSFGGPPGANSEDMQLAALAVNHHDALMLLAKHLQEWYEDSGSADPDRTSKGSVSLWNEARAVLAEIDEEKEKS